MVDLSAITGSGVGGAKQDKSETETKRSELGQEDFLNLMVTQLKNQDPLKPMQNEDFLAQIAQFTSATGIQELSASFQAFQSDMQTDQALRASSLLGRSVVVESERGYLSETGELNASVQVPEAVENLTVGIVDGAGQMVRRLDLGRHSAGQANFSWDGTDADGNRLPPGRYALAAQTVVDGEALTLQTHVDAEVRSVTLARGGEPPKLALEGLGELSLAAVRQVK